jgi:hypothetical protein
VQPLRVHEDWDGPFQALLVQLALIFDRRSAAAFKPVFSPSYANGSKP